MKFSVVIAARTGSSRLPGKALLPLGGLPMIRFLIRRVRSARRPAHMVFATTTLPEDDRLAQEAAAEGLSVFRGANEDVVQRYVDVATALEAEYVVRITGDCPFVDAETLDHCLDWCERQGDFDIASTKTAFPVGIDYEIYKAQQLLRIHHSGLLSPSDREHLTKYFYDHPQEFKVRLIAPRPEWTGTRRIFTVDTPQDYEAAQRIVGAFADSTFSVAQLVSSEESRP